MQKTDISAEKVNINQNYMTLSDIFTALSIGILQKNNTSAGKININQNYKKTLSDMTECQHRGQPPGVHLFHFLLFVLLPQLINADGVPLDSPDLR